MAQGRIPSPISKSIYHIKNVRNSQFNSHIDKKYKFEFFILRERWESDVFFVIANFLSQSRWMNVKCISAVLGRIFLCSWSPRRFRGAMECWVSPLLYSTFHRSAYTPSSFVQQQQRARRENLSWLLVSLSLPLSLSLSLSLSLPLCLSLSLSLDYSEVPFMPRLRHFSLMQRGPGDRLRMLRGCSSSSSSSPVFESPTKKFSCSCTYSSVTTKYPMNWRMYMACTFPTRSLIRSVFLSFAIE